MLLIIQKKTEALISQASSYLMSYCGEIDVPWLNEREVHDDSLKCLQFVLVSLDAVQCILVVDNMLVCVLRPLLLHKKCHSMCMYSFTLIMTLSSFLDTTKQAIQCFLFTVLKVKMYLFSFIFLLDIFTTQILLHSFRFVLVFDSTEIVNCCFS